MRSSNFNHAKSNLKSVSRSIQQTANIAHLRRLGVNSKALPVAFPLLRCPMLIRKSSMSDPSPSPVFVCFRLVISFRYNHQSSFEGSLNKDLIYLNKLGGLLSITFFRRLLLRVKDELISRASDLTLLFMLTWGICLFLLFSPREQQKKAFGTEIK
jgi:hypothetical protein